MRGEVKDTAEMSSSGDQENDDAINSMGVSRGAG